MCGLTEDDRLAMERALRDDHGRRWIEENVDPEKLPIDPTVRRLVLDTLRLQHGTQWLEKHRTMLDSQWEWVKDF